MQLDRRSRMYVAMVLVAYMAYEAKVQLARNVLFTTGGGVKHLESLAASVDAGKLGGGAPTAHGKADVHGLPPPDARVARRCARPLLYLLERRVLGDRRAMDRGSLYCSAASSYGTPSRAGSGDDGSDASAVRRRRRRCVRALYSIAIKELV